MKIVDYLLKVFLVLSIFAFTNSCGDDGDDDEKNTTSTDTSTVFNSSTNLALSNSVMTLPGSLVVSTGSSLKLAEDSSSGTAGIYSGMRNYIGMCDMFGKFVKEIMTNIVSDSLKNVPLNTEFTIPDRSGDDDPYRIKVEKPENATYEWKISIFFTESGTSPEMIVRFTLVNDKAKGRLLWAMTEDITEDEDNGEVLKSANVTGVTITRKIDLTFDNTTSAQTLEVKLIQDLDSIATYARQNWSSLSSSVKDALDLGQPGKVFVYATYENNLFTIKGTSYHPHWSTQAELDGGSTMWGDNDRSMYMFKAKSTEDSGAGAKMYLALPKQTTSDVTNVWTTDSLANIHSAKMLAQVNAMLERYSNSTDEADTDGTNSANLSVTEEQARAASIMRLLLNNSTLNTKTSTSDIQTWLTTNRGSNAYILTQAELENFVDTSTDSNAANLKSTYSSIKYMINPAFFNKDNGFLGTHDESSDIFYAYTNNALAAGSKPTNFTDLSALDLSSINPYVPTEVVSASISVE